MKVSGRSLFRSGIRFPMSYVFQLCDSRSRELRTSISEKPTTASESTRTLKSFTIDCWSLGGKKVAAWKIYYLLWQQGTITASTRSPNLPNNYLSSAKSSRFSLGRSVCSSSSENRDG